MIEPDVTQRRDVDPDHQFDQLVCEVSASLEAGRPVDVDALAEAHPQHIERLRKLLPTLQAMADLGHSFTGSPQVAPQQQAGPALTAGVLGDFRILREVGRGGMGVVYEVEQISLGRRMALKVLPFAGVLDERQLTRFRNEARAAASLDHPNVVGVHSVGTERGVHYYAMEFIEGETLAQVIAERRASSPRPRAGEGPGVRGTEPTETFRTSPHPAPAEPRSPNPAPQDSRSLEDFGSLPSPDPQPAAPNSSPADTNRQPQAQVSTEKTPRAPEFFRRVADWGIQAAEGLEHAHQMGVVHRDIKPSNLMVNAEGHLWITDFGLAQIQADAGITITGDILGTLRYMSPEQAQGNRRAQDHRSDIYSLGVTLYELLALKPPFASHDRHALMHEIADGNPPPLRQLNRSIPRDLETIVLKALATDPQARYATAQQMADDLKRFLAHEPIRARRPTLADRMTKWSRRHRPVVWSAATLLLIVAMIAGAIFWNGYRRAVALEKDVSEHLAAAAALLEAADYAAAGRELVESRTRLEMGGYGEGPLADETERIADLLSAKNQAIERFDQFQKLRHRIHSEMYAVDRAILDQAQGHCRTALDLYEAMASDSWKQQRGFQDLSPERQASLEEGVVELLFVWARLEIGKSDGQATAELQAGHRRAVDAFSRIQTFQKPIPALYLWIADSWETVGEKKAATEARAKAEAIQPSTAMDYFLLSEHHAQHGRHDEAVASYWQALAQQPDHYLSLLAVGVTLVELKEYKSAEGVLTGAIAMNPQTVVAYAKRGVSRLEQGKILLAQADFQQARRIDPDLARALVRRAEEFSAKHDFERALAECSEAIRIDPKSAWAYVTRGSIYFNQGRLYKALDDLNCAVRLDPGSVYAYSLRSSIYRNKGQPAEALADAEECLRLDRKEASGYLARGWVYMDRGELDKALADMNEGMRLDPRNSGAFFARADVYCKLREWEKALADFEKLIQLDPKNFFGYMSRAAIQQEKGDFARALTDYNEAVRIGGPQCAYPYLSRARFHRDRGNFDKAVADYKETFRADPTWLGVLACDELARLYVDKGDVAQAAAVYDQVKDFGTNPYLYRNRAALRFRVKRYAEALDDLTKVVEFQPDRAGNLLWIPPEQVAKCPDDRLRKGLLELADKTIEKTKGAAEAYSVRARLYGAFGQPEKALADFAKAIELKPKNAEVWARRATFHQERGEWEKAIADSGKAIELKPNKAIHWLRRGDVYSAWGKWPSAIADYEKAHQLEQLGVDDINGMAWLLTTCPDRTVWKPDRALQFAQRAVARAPNNGMYWNTLGVAQYRAEDYKAAIASLAKGMELRSGGDAFDWFFLAMAHGQLKNPDEARKWYDKAVAWMEKNKSDDEELRRFRAEAAELLGIVKNDKKPPAGKAKTGGKG